MAHPEHGISCNLRAGLLRISQTYACKNAVSAVNSNISSAVLADRSRGNFAPQLVCQKLSAVADAKDGNPQFKNLRVSLRRFFAVHAVGAAGKNNPRRSHFLYIVY